MRCIVHICTSEEHGQKHFSLHILPLNAPERHQSTEVFLNERDLERRLVEIGLAPCYRETTLHNLEDGLAAMWTNVEIEEKSVRPAAA